MQYVFDAPPNSATIQRLRDIAKKEGLPIIVTDDRRAVSIGGDRRQSFALIARLARGGV